MQSQPLSPSQCCLRLQSVFRAHRTRRYINQRSRSEFERILAELEPEPTRPRVVYPLTFICRPLVQCQAAQAASTVTTTTAPNSSSERLSLLPASSPSVSCHTDTKLAAVVHANAHVSTNPFPAPSPAPSAPNSSNTSGGFLQSPSSQSSCTLSSESLQSSSLPPSHDSIATAAADSHPPIARSNCVSIGVGTADDCSDVPLSAIILHHQHQYFEHPPNTSCDAASQSCLTTGCLSASDVCGGALSPPLSHSSHQDAGVDIWSGVLCRNDATENCDQLGDCSSRSRCRSYDASSSSSSVPPSPPSPEQLETNHRSYSSPRTFSQPPSPPLSKSASSSESGSDVDNFDSSHRNFIGDADSSFNSKYSAASSSVSNHRRQPPSPLSLDTLSPLPPPPPTYLDFTLVDSSLERHERGSPEASPSNLNHSSISNASNSSSSSSKRSLDAIMAATSSSMTRTVPQTPAASACVFDPSILLNPPLTPSAAANLSPVEKVSLKQKLQKDLEWTQLMLQQRLMFLKQQQ